ncbi:MULTISPECIES: DUF4129 domain-containing protein [Natrialbaceae]|uniref:DUF4129 domain-containing protein n=1 Tax=Natrialbaceae TaxID=1644061 RepID=UPI00207D40FB|nr:DUF4129 domain-containing protein [Natronococcus sp. CG52]
MSRREPFIRLVAAVAGIVAIALAAATVRSPLETGGSGGTGGGGSGSGTGQPPPADPSGSGEIPPFLEYLVYVVVALVAVVVVWYLLANRREAVKLIAIGLIVALVTVVLAYGLVTAGDVVLSSNVSPQEPANESPVVPGDGGEPGSGDDGSSMPTSPLLVVLALLAAVFVGGVLLSRDSGGTDGAVAEPGAAAPTTEEAEAAAVGSAAGRAADRIDEGTAVDNEVYRAWREMTALLEVERPESSTPREFADAAVDAGLERDHVEELTRLFEDVRYGDVETTAAMEERAVSVLRRIETEYARDESESADTGDDRRITDGGGST